jgi:hypothetical protein
VQKLYLCKIVFVPKRICDLHSLGDGAVLPALLHHEAEPGGEPPDDAVAGLQRRPVLWGRIGFAKKNGFVQEKKCICAKSDVVRVDVGGGVVPAGCGDPGRSHAMLGCGQRLQGCTLHTALHCTALHCTLHCTL